MSMDIETLRWFVAVADGATVGDTADEYRASQPAVSRGLQRLSVELGTPLTERAGRRLRLTPAGQLLVGPARRAVAELDEAARAVAEASDPASGTVRLGFLSPLGTWLVPKLLLALRTERPRVRFVLRHDGASRILDALLDGELDLLLSIDPGLGRCRWEPLFADELAVSVADNHPLADRAEIALTELRDEPWVLQVPGHGLRQQAEELCRMAGFTPRIAFEGHDLSTLYALIGAGSGIGVFTTRPAPPAGVRHIRLSPPVYRTVGLVSVAGAVRVPSVDAFADLVRSLVPRVDQTGMG
jgi:LysR family transcriptional regulator, transcription activator of glutamate synthase operon